MSNIDRDPVEEFFERERNAIVSQDGNDVHWQGIVRRARAHRRSRLFGYAAGVAAAGLVIGGVTYGAFLHNGTVPLTTATNAGPSAIQTPRPVATGEQKPVPKSFAAMSISNVGQGSIFVLGSSDCGNARRCPVLIGSTDNGRTWHLLSSFTSNVLPTRPTFDGAVQAANVLSQVRFANATVGWVFGGDVHYTTDGGKTFRPYDHVGQAVIDIETDGNQVIVTSADGCSSGVCGAGHVARASITAPGATSELGTGPSGGELSDLQVVFDAKAPFLSPRWRSAPTSGFGPQRITASGLEPLGGLGGACGSPNEQDIIATADRQGGLFAICATPGAAMGSIGMAVFSSNNQGSSWDAASSNALIMVNSGPRSFAAASSKDVLAASAGNQDTHGSLQVSHDGGKTWRSPGSPPPMPTYGWAWVGAPGGKTFYAVSADAVPAYWQSDDSGETWTRVGLTS
jgi:hypothetical protein